MPYESKPGTVSRIFEIYEKQAMDESGQFVTIIKKEEEPKKIKK